MRVIAAQGLAAAATRTAVQNRLCRPAAAWVLFGLMAMAGCSTVPDRIPPGESARVSTSPHVESDLEPERVSELEVAEVGSADASHRDELQDPFAASDDSATEEDSDPWEPFNMVMFDFNRQVDRYVLKPIAQGYDVVVPDRVQVGVSNFFYNLRFPPRFLNNVFQGKIKGAGVEMGRFLVNSTLGLAGFLDIAGYMDLQTPEEDAGQTLGFYGVTSGPYLVLPFLPPLNLRDGFGFVVDIALNPINWLVLPIIEAHGVPSVIAHKNRTTTSIVQIGGRVGEILNDRSRNLEKFQGVEEATLDLYTAVRNAYRQKRAKAILE